MLFVDKFLSLMHMGHKRHEKNNRENHVVGLFVVFVAFVDNSFGGFIIEISFINNFDF